METIEKISEEITVLVEYAGNACGSARVAELFGVEDNDELKTILSDFEDEWDEVEVDKEGATPEQDAKLDAILESYRKKIAHEDEIHTIEDVELTKDGYHHDCLTYVADGWFEFDPNRSIEERCEIARRTALTPEMTYEERLSMQRRRYGL